MPVPVARLYENRLMLIGIPLFMAAFYAGNQYYKEPFTLALAGQIGQALVLATAVWLVARSFRAALLRRLPGYGQTVGRIALTVLGSGLAGMVINAGLYELPAVLREGKALGIASFAAYFGPMFFYSALVTGAHEVVHNFFELRRMDQEREELKKAHLQSQLDSLKSQVNPHFLFNSLNTLLSLIPTSPERAERFVEELSSVYRYLLQANQHELATLRQELDFAQSYFHLLKTRFGAGITLTQHVDDDLLGYRLPSLTLQLLLENAVKHNVILAGRPLVITIATATGERGEGPRLVVRNNLQRKVQPVASGRMGLNNIVAKLKLLNQAEPTIREDGDYFTVTLPLLK
jgi:hypothetical protein